MKPTHALCLSALLAFFGAETSAQSGWYIQHRDSLGPELLSVHFTDALTGWTVGDGTTILHTTDGGITWYAQTNGVVGGFFESVYFVDSNTGWVAGNLNTILHTTNGGNTWETQRHSNDPVGYSSICFSDAARGWAVGWVSWVNSHFIVHTTDGGNTWTEQRWGGGLLRSVCFVDSLTGCVVGDYGAILHTTNGGTTWEAQSSGASAFLVTVCFLDALTGWACGGETFGSGVILKTTNGGSTWFEQARDSAGWFRALSFVDGTKGWAVRDNEPGASIYHTADGGNTWSEQANCSPRLYSIWFMDSLTGWAAGQEGTILHTTNGGVTFVEEENPIELPIQYILSQNYPNPFNPSTTIEYTLPHRASVAIKVLDVLGREVRTLLNEEKPAGAFTVRWNADGVASGMYFYRLKAGGFVQTRKMLLLK